MDFENKRLFLLVLFVGAILFGFGMALVLNEDIDMTSITNILRADTIKKVEYTKLFNDTDNTLVIIRNSTGDRMVEMKLLSGLNRAVFRGTNRTVFEIEVNPIEQNVQKFMTSVELYNVVNGQIGDRTEREINLQWREKIGQKKVNDYETVCYNQTEITDAQTYCYPEVIGTHFEPIYQWNDFEADDFNALPKEIVVVRGIADVYPNDHVEWIPTFFETDTLEGVKINEWATWTDNFNTGLISYWTLNETGTNVRYDSLGRNNLTATGTSDTAGIINNSVDFGGAGDNLDGIALSNYSFGTNPFTVNFWVKSGAIADNLYLIGTIGGGGWHTAGRWDVITETDGRVRLQIAASGSGYASTGQIDNGAWHMVTFVREGTGTNEFKIYIDGSLDSSHTNADNANDANDFDIGSESLSDFVGQIDEVSIYSRAWNSTEASDAWNGGAGITWTTGGGVTDNPPQVRLNAPANASVITNYNVYFAANLLDDYKIDNSTLYIWNSTGDLYNTYFNTHSTNETLVNQSVTFTPTDNNQIYHWNYLTWDNSTAMQSAWNDTNWTINLSIVSTAIVLSSSLTNPADNYLSGKTNVNLSATGTVNYANFTNATITVRNLTGDIYYQNTNTSIKNLFNTTSIVNWSSNFVHGNYTWNVEFCAINVTSDTECDLGDANRSFEIDTKPPIITYTEIADQFVGTSSVDVSLNFTATDVGGAGISSCWFSNETGGNETAVCGIAQTLTYTSTGIKNIIMYANDTLNNVNYTNQSFEIGNYLQAVNKETIAEGDIATFNLTLNKIGIGSLDVNANLSYNGTIYTTPDSQTVTTNQVIITKSIPIPRGAGSVNGSIAEWFWNFTVSTLGNYKTENQNQTVYSVEIDDCSGFSDLLLNISIYDEDTRTFLDNTTYNTTANVKVILSQISSGVTFSNYSFSSANNPVQVCSIGTANLTSDYRLDSEIQYYTDLHVTEYYYINNYTLNESLIPLNIPLYDLLITRSQEFLITYKDQNFLPVAGVYIELTRQYLNIDQFLTVEIGKTDYDGRTISHFVLNDELYTIYVKQEGQLLATYENVRAFCDDVVTGDCRINLNEFGSDTDIDDFSSYKEIVANSVYNDTSKVYTVVFTSTDNIPKSVEINITNYTNPSDVICSSRVYSSSGTLSCTVTPEYYNSTALSKLFVNGELKDTSIFKINSKIFVRSDEGTIIIGFLYILTITLLSIANPAIGLVLFLVGIVLVGSLSLINFGPLVGAGSVLVWAIIAVAILIWKVTDGGKE